VRGTAPSNRSSTAHIGCNSHRVKIIAILKKNNGKGGSPETAVSPIKAVQLGKDSEVKTNSKHKEYTDRKANINFTLPKTKDSNNQTLFETEEAAINARRSWEENINPPPTKRLREVAKTKTLRSRCTGNSATSRSVGIFWVVIARKKTKEGSRLTELRNHLNKGAKPSFSITAKVPTPLLHPRLRVRRINIEASVCAKK